MKFISLIESINAQEALMQLLNEILRRERPYAFITDRI